MSMEIIRHRWMGLMVPAEGFEPQTITLTIKHLRFRLSKSCLIFLHDFRRRCLDPDQL